MSRRPGFPHRVTLDLTKEQFDTLTDAADQAGATLVDYMRALIELHREDSELTTRAGQQMRIMRANRRRTRRTRQELSAA
ncbi:hypothetical protein ACFV2X_48085 [Streptomyces sp. NPDC059679]|uniref:hypothetical protein n=1 Tax=Streptomyces sp. NPDC059679 TaxID=3346903 RepID=UPI0036933F8D